MMIPKSLVRLLFIFVLVPGVLVLGSCDSRVQPTPDSPTRQSSHETSSDAHLEAWEAYRSHEFDRVIELLAGIEDQRQPDVDAARLLARAYYEKNKFQAASRLWNRVVPLLNNPEARNQARKFRDRAEKLDRLNLSVHEYNHFVILVPPELSRADANRVNHQLERAYQAVGSDLNTYPKRKISVLIHRPGPFRRVMDGPIWSGGLFDGKIHIKYDETKDIPYDRRTLVHEYTHALVHSHARDNVPLWFNEGLATFQEFRQVDGEFRYTMIEEHPPEKTIRQLSDINNMFQDEEGDKHGRNQVRLAYEYSHSLVRFFEERYGLYLIQDLLKRTGETSDFEQALLETVNQNEQNLRFSWESWL